MLLPAGTHAVYFQAAAVIVMLILLGQYLNARTRDRTGDAIRNMASLRATTARVERNCAICALAL